MKIKLYATSGRSLPIPVAAEGGAKTRKVLGSNLLVGRIDGDRIDGDKARAVYSVTVRDKCTKMETAKI